MNVTADVHHRSMTLTDVAGRRVKMLAGVSFPTHLAGAVTTHGVARWIFVAVAVACIVELFDRRRAGLTFWNGISGIAVSVAAIVMLACWAPQLILLATANLAVTTVFSGLMLPRPTAEAGIAVIPVTFAVSQLVFASGEHLPSQVVGIALANIALGASLLGLRIATERTITAHNNELATVNRRLTELSRTDSLTGLTNRRGLDESLSQLWADASGNETPLAVVMIDVDYFKKYNDHYGHPLGDECLKKVAAVLATSVRDIDQVARYGGEEFVIVMPGADREIACQIAGRVRENVERLREEHATSPVGYVTVSGGVSATVPGGATSMAQLLEQADDGLYGAKRDGRNRIGVAPAAAIVS